MNHCLYFYFQKIFDIRIFLIFLFLSGCNKLDRTGIGNELIPGGDRLVTDTLYLNVETKLRNTDSLNLDSTVIQKNEAHCLGYVNDPAFGKTTASIYLQTLPLRYPLKFPVSKDSLFLDSLVLSLAYAGTYGDTNTVSKAYVYKLADPEFIYTKQYKLYESPQVSTNELLGSTTYTRSKITSVTKLDLYKDSAVNTLRINLNEISGIQLGRSILDQDNITGAFLNDSAFKKFLNGFAIIPDSLSGNNGALHYFALNAPNTKLILYYRMLKKEGGTDTTFASFPFSADFNRSANANKIHRTLSAQVVNDPQYAYVMTAPGISTNLEIKGLEALAGKPYIVHRAEIIATQAEDNTVSPIFTPPVTHLYSINDLGQQTTIPFDSDIYFNRVSFDFRRNVFLNSISVEYCGGNPVYRTINNQKLAEYRYNVTRYVQNVINKKIGTRSFRISAPYNAEFAGGNISLFPLNALAAGRIKLYGGSHPTKPMRLIVYYSKP